MLTNLSYYPTPVRDGDYLSSAGDLACSKDNNPLKAEVMASNPRVHIIDTLLKKGFCPDLNFEIDTIHEKNTCSLIEFAIKYRPVDTALCLLRASKQLDQRNSKGRSLLQVIIESIKTENTKLRLIRMLLQKTSRLKQPLNLDFQDVNGETALHLAVRNPKAPKIVGELLYENANVNIEDLEGNTPLHIANGALNTFALLKNGASVRAANNKGSSPLWSFCRTYSCGAFCPRPLEKEQFVELVKFGSDLKHINQNRQTTPIQEMKEEGTFETLKMALESEKSKLESVSLYLFFDHSKIQSLEVLNSIELAPEIITEIELAYIKNIGSKFVSDSNYTEDSFRNDLAKLYCTQRSIGTFKLDEICLHYKFLKNINKALTDLNQ